MDNGLDLQQTVKALLAANKTGEAESIVQRWLDEGGEARVGSGILATIFSHAGRYADAEKLYSDLSAVEPLGVSLEHNRATNLIDGGIDGAWGSNRASRIREATETLQRLIAEDPRFFTAHYNLANAFAAIGNHEESRAHLHFALDGGETPEALVNLANTYRTLHRFSEAIDLYVAALRIRRDHDMAWANLADGFCHAYFQTAGKFPHLLVLAEICCRRSLDSYDGQSRAQMAVQGARAFIQNHGMSDVSTATLRAWESWFELPAEGPNCSTSIRFAPWRQLDLRDPAPSVVGLLPQFFPLRFSTAPAVPPF